MNFFKNSKPVIAIDGTAGSGKGTLAKNLSQKLAFDHLDTGILYRIYAYEYINIKDKKNIKLLDLKKWFENKDKLKKLRTEKISKIASEISQKKEVRDSLLAIQRNFANNPPNGKGSVIDGRDIGTVIIPKAEIKFFLDANIEIRASRRIDQINLGPSHYKATLNNMVNRDNKDSKRKISPLTIAKDSCFIDTSILSENEVLEIAMRYIKKNTDFI